MRNGIRDRRKHVFTKAACAAAGAVAASAVLNPAPPVAHAATQTWNGEGGNALWQTPANWVGGVAPLPDDSLVFEGVTQLANQNNYASGTVFKGITFAPTAGAFSLSGNSINLGVQTTGTGITTASDIVNGSASTQVVNLPLVLQPGKHTISTATTPLILSGAITQSKGSTAVFSIGGPGAINVSGSGLANDASGILGGWATIGANWAVVDGSSNIVPYAGYTDVAGGGVIADAPTTNVRIPVNGAAVTTAAGTTRINSLLFGGPSGAAQTVTVGAGNTLVLGGNGGVFNATGTGGTLRALTIAGGTLTAGDSTNGGNITLSSSLLPSTATFMTVNSAITDNGAGPVSVTIMGGYAALTGVNTHSGGTYILSGRVSQPTAATFGSGPVHIFAGGQINPGGAASINITNNLFIAGNGTAENNGLGAVRMFQNTTGNSTLLSGTVTLTDTASVSSNGNADVNRNVGITGRITGPGGLMIGSPTSNANANGSGIVVIGALTGAGAPNDYAGDTTINGTLGGAVGSTLRIASADADNVMPHGAAGSFAAGPTGNIVLNATTASRKAVFDLNGSQQTINGLSNTSTSAADNFVGSFAAGGHLVLGDNNASATFTGIVQDGASGGAGTLAVTKIGSGTQALSGTNTYTGGTTVNAGTLQVRRMHENNPVSITGGKLQVIDSSPTLPSHPSGDNAFVSRPSALTIANNGGAIGARTYNGQLDLGNNDLILDYDGASPIANIEDMVRAGYNGGNWLGNGITSSTANANSNFAVGVADNARLTIKYDATRPFSGQTVDDTTILVKFTHRIDLDLDGVITSNDATIFNSSYTEGQPAYWSIGDLDYDRVFTTNDATLFNSFYSEALASVPEPAAGVVILAGALLARRRVR